MRSAGVEIAYDVARELTRDGHLNVHDWLEQHRTRLRKRGFEPNCTGRLEGRLARVNRVILAENKRALHVDHGVTSDHTLFEGLADSLFDRRDELAGDDAADHLVHKLKAFTARRRLDFEIAHPVLAVPA